MSAYSMLMNNVFASTAAIIPFSNIQNFLSDDVFLFFFARDGIMLHKLALAATKHNVVHLR